MTDTDDAIVDAESAPAWGPAAPKGGRAVLGRMLREGSTVPLFLGQTFVNSLRDVGYTDTTSAVCEHVDNAIQAGATEVRVYFNQTGRKGAYAVDVVILDNGRGMDAQVLQVATSFGGSMHYDDRRGIGRFGVGMKTAALSMGPALELYSWQEPGSIYTMTLDVNEIGADRSNMIVLPPAQLLRSLPPALQAILITPMAYPREADQQRLLARDLRDMPEALGRSGTIVHIPNADRLSSKTARTLVDHATRDMSRIYRRYLESGLRLYINNRRLEAFDPTYWMAGARHTRIEGVQETRSRLINSWPDIQVPVEENSSITAPVSVKLYMLPIEDWYDLPRKTLQNALHVFEDHTVSFMRNGREVHIGTVQELTGRRHGDVAWLRLQLDFGGELDEAFGVAMNKQGVRPKKYVFELIHAAIKDDVSKLRDRTAQFRAEHTRDGSRSSLTAAEQIAQEADNLQTRPLRILSPESDDERQALDQNLRTLAVALKRHQETDDEAFERIKSSTFVTAFKHDQYWPFYHVDFQFGKVILTINTAHAFFTQLYEPLSRLSSELGGGEEGGKANSNGSDVSSLLVGLQMLLLSLARTQSQILSNDPSGEHQLLFENLRTEWSATLKTQLLAARRL